VASHLASTITAGENYPALSNPGKSALESRTAGLSVSSKPSPDYYLELARLESTRVPCGLQLALKSLDRGIARLGPLVSLQSAAIDFEIERGDYRQALARHETLRPWLGKTSQWQYRHRQLAEKLSVTTSGSIDTVE